MNKESIKFNEECPSCGGTGLYVGMAERDGAAVVCHKCRGTGCFEFSYTYTPFASKKNKKGVKHVYETNPGICIGNGNGYKFEDFGGMTYEDWAAGKKFKIGMENRKYTCPSWWYQTANYKKKPEWKECYENLGGSFSGCKLFGVKEKCWEKWDKTIGSKK